MAKSVLVDFRGGINQKISPHMIGDSQGQDGEDLDLSTVRLQGRKEIDAAASSASGSFLYNVGDGGITPSRWVSEFTQDSSSGSYIEFASDFSVWNRDLYVALGATVDSTGAAGSHANGQTIRFLDGQTTSQVLSFDPPQNTSTVSFGEYDLTDGGSTSTLTDSAWDRTIVPAVSATTPPESHNRTSIIAVSKTPADDDTANGSGNWVWMDITTFNSYNADYNTGTYSIHTSAEEAAFGGRDIYRKSGSTTNYYLGEANNPVPFSNETEGYLYTRSGNGIVSQSTAVHNQNYNTVDFTIEADGSIDSNKVITGGSVIDGRNSSGQIYYQYSDWNANTYYSRSVNDAANDPLKTGTPSTLSDNVLTTTATWKWTRPLIREKRVTTGNLHYMQQYYISPSWPYYTAEGRTTVYNYDDTNSTSFLILIHNGLVSNYTEFSSVIVYQYNSEYVMDANGYLKRTGYTSTLSASSTGNIDIIICTKTSGVGGSTNGTTYYLSRGSTWSASYQSSGGNSFLVYSRDLAVYDPTALTTTTSGSLEVTGGGAGVTPFNVSHTSSGLQYSDTSYLDVGNLEYSRSSTITSHDPPYFSAFNANLKSYEASATITVKSPKDYASLTDLSLTQYLTDPNTTYTEHTDTTPFVTATEPTDAFIYDDVRSNIYQVNTPTNPNPTVISDASRGTNWLSDGKAFTGPLSSTSYGYFLKTVRNTNNFPTLSPNETRLTVSGSGTEVLSTNAEHTPQRLKFSITDPTDVGTAPAYTPPDAYRLYRKDTISTVDLGYIKPSRLNNTVYDPDVEFSYNSSNQQVTISNLLEGSNYRLKWWAYQQTELTSFSIAGTADTSFVTASSNTSGHEFTKSGTSTFSVVIQLATRTNGDSRMYACDFWLEESVLIGSDANSTTDDTFATIKCYDLVHDTATPVLPSDNVQIIESNSDFLDLFSSSLLSDGLGTGSTINAPDYCKFFKESNNFFFAVGTENSANTLYGGSSNVNKKGSYLFISEYNDPTTWYATGYLQFDAEITGLHAYPGELIVWTENATYRVTGSRYDQMRKVKLATTEGMLEGNHRTSTIVNGYLVWLSQSGICIYDGTKITNLTRGRFNDFGFSTSQRTVSYGATTKLNGLHAGQYDGVYYLIGADETGYSVDFNLEGFPVNRVDLKEDGATLTAPSVLFYDGSTNRLVSRRGVIGQGTADRPWTYRTRAFDGGSFGRNKLVHSIEINGKPSNGTIKIYLDNSLHKTVSVTTSTILPLTVYLNPMAIGDVWSVELSNWEGSVDYIATEFEVI